MISPKHLFQLFVKAGKAWVDDFAPSMGAAISYYTVFSLAPLLIIVIAMAGAVFGREAVQGQIVAQLSGLMGEQGASLIQGLLASASDTDKGLVAGLISLVVLIVGATTVFAELQSALDRIWHVPEAKKPSGIMGILRARLLSFGLILGLVFLLMVSLAVSTAVTAMGSWAGGLMPGSEALLLIANHSVSIGVETLLFAMIYKLMPTARIAWRDVWVGAFVTAVLFEIGKFLIGIYLGKSSVTESFAAAGSLVVFLAWVYYAAQIFLLGAEFTKVYADDHGSRVASGAMDKTAQTKEAGVPAETPATSGGAVPVPVVAAVAAKHEGRRLVADTVVIERAEPSPVIRTVDVGMHAAMAKLMSELAAFAVLALASTLLAKKRKAIEQTLRRRDPTVRPAARHRRRLSLRA